MVEVKIGDWLDKPFKEATKKDIIKVVQIIETQDYTAHTKHDYKIVVKRFYQWLRSSDDYPEEVRWIKSTIKRNDSMIPDELLTAEEIKKLIETAEHPRNKAMISALYESGCRPSEFLYLCIKHIVFDKIKAQIVINFIFTYSRPLIGPPKGNPKQFVLNSGSFREFFHCLWIIRHYDRYPVPFFRQCFWQSR